MAATRPLLFDTSVLIPMIRGEAYEDFFQRALRTGRARLSSVVMQELYAGAHTQADKRDYDGINRAFLSRGYTVPPDHEAACPSHVPNGLSLHLQHIHRGEIS